MFYWDLTNTGLPTPYINLTKEGGLVFVTLSCDSAIIFPIVLNKKKHQQILIKAYHALIPRGPKTLD